MTMLVASETAKRAAPWPCRPAVGFLHPLEVVKDGDLDLRAKREILAAWASDASAVEDRPTHRWLLGTSAPVPVSEVLAALRRLDAASPS
ncbi:hypothetical protein GCM10010983_28030 [Caulobacter rhizosphaerae]|jgi:hypothetical protein|nr:hypothetical protein GCM10010983_28030 [Caulobacter rhizosphaerae]